MSFPPNLVPGVTFDTTKTSGSGTLTLENNPPTGYRSFAGAFADGDLASGDEVTFAIWDSTVPYPGDIFEIATGIWTNSGGGGTLTRATTHQPNGSPIPWPASGTRNVLVIPDGLQRRQNLGDLDNAATARANLDAAGLNDPNFFLQSQSVITTGAGLQTWASDQSTGNPFQLRMGGRNGSGATIYYGYIRPRITNATAGNEGSRLEMLVQSAGLLTEVLRVNADGSLDNVVAGTKFDNFPSGTKMLFGGAIPAGWTRVNEAASRTIKLAQSADTIGNTGGSIDPFTAHSTQSYTLTVADMPAHSHQYRSGGGAGTDAPTLNTGAPIGAAGTTVKGEGGGGGHAHGISAIQHTIWAAATKN